MLEHQHAIGRSQRHRAARATLAFCAQTMAYSPAMPSKLASSRVARVAVQRVARLQRGLHHAARERLVRAALLDGQLFDQTLPPRAHR